MLRFMRKQASSWMIKVLLGIIVLVFVFWGMGSMTGRQVTHVATVNGEQISVDAFRQAYNNLVENMRQRYGDSLDDETLKMLKPDKMALDELIRETLLKQEAKKLGIRVSDRELVDSIQKTEYFLKNGAFDYDRYKQVLNSVRMNQQTYEARQQQEMLINKLAELVFNQVRVSEAEAREWFNWNQAEVRIDYVAFVPETYSDVTASEEEIAAYFESNKNNYKTEPAMKVRYLRFLPDRFLDQAAVTQEEIQAYYDDHLETYKEEKTVEASHILFKLGKDADAATVENRRLEALKVMEMAKAGTDFAELARKFSEEPSKKKGGSLGVFKRDAMVEPFADKAFSMKPGEISEPVQTPFGWHIIRVEKVNEEKTRKLEDATPEIEKILKLEKARQFAYDKAEAVYDSSFEGDDLVTAANHHQIEVQATGFISKSKMPEGIPDGSAFTEAAFKLEPMEISDILDMKDGFYLIQVMEKTEAQVPPIADVRDQVRKDLVREKQEKKAADEAAAFLKAAAGGKFAEKAGEQKISVKTTPFFRRSGAVPEIGPSPEFKQAIYGLSPAKTMPEKPIKAGNVYYVIEFKDSRPPEDALFEKEKKTVLQELRKQKQMRAYNAWMAQLKETSDIKIENEFLN